MVCSVSRYFRQVALSLQGCRLQGTPEEAKTRGQELSQAFEALKVYRAAIDSIEAKENLARLLRRSALALHLLLRS